MVLRLFALLQLQFLRLASPEPLPACAATECADEAKLMRAELLQRDLFLNIPNQAQLLQHEFVPDRPGLARAGATKRWRSTTLPPPSSVSDVGILMSFVSCTVVCVTLTIVVWAVFCKLRLQYPAIYSDNMRAGLARGALPDTLCGWFGATVSLSIDDVAEHVTLDAAMLLEFSHLCMRILAVAGIPMLCVIVPVKWAFGDIWAERDFRFHSVGNASDSWLCWIHAFVVWCVVVVVTHQLHLAMQDFLPRRFKWLREMSESCASTVVVDRIPPPFQSEGALGAFFQQVLPGASIKSVYVCKDTSDLEQFGKLLERASYNLKIAEGTWRQAGMAPDCRPMLRDPVLGSQIEAIPFWKTQLVELAKHIKDCRDLIEQCSPSSVNTSSGFVTFSDRTSAAIAVRLSGHLGSDEDSWHLDNAPEPDDVLWAGFRQDDIVDWAKGNVGHTLVAALFLVCLPLAIGITNIAALDSPGHHFLYCVWAGIAPVLGLQLLVASLPTLLSLTFQCFFMLKSLVGLQLKIQVWYFWFQVALVLLAAALGQNYRLLLRTFILEPLSLLGALVETMGFATHFFRNFLVLQWLSFSVEVLRLGPLLTFRGACSLLGEKDAKKLAESEDQNFGGIGSRSTRLTVMMSIAIIFSTFAPIIAVLAFLGFALCRVIYGYLTYFSETKKNDSGGVFWVTKLRHIFVACIVYSILMTAVLLHCGGRCWPGLIAAPSILWAITSKARFERYRWESLSLHELTQGTPCTTRPSMGQYVQPELLLRPDC